MSDKLPTTNFWSNAQLTSAPIAASSETTPTTTDTSKPSDTVTVTQCSKRIQEMLTIPMELIEKLTQTQTKLIESNAELMSSLIRHNRSFGDLINDKNEAIRADTGCTPVMLHFMKAFTNSYKTHFIESMSNLAPDSPPETSVVQPKIAETTVKPVESKSPPAATGPSDTFVYTTPIKVTKVDASSPVEAPKPIVTVAKPAVTVAKPAATKKAHTVKKKSTLKEAEPRKKQRKQSQKRSREQSESEAEVSEFEDASSESSNSDTDDEQDKRKRKRSKHNAKKATAKDE
jgi:hypothetical protein